jgi:hypothetical protein
MPRGPPAHPPRRMLPPGNVSAAVFFVALSSATSGCDAGQLATEGRLFDVTSTIGVPPALGRLHRAFRGAEGAEALDAAFSMAADWRQDRVTASRASFLFDAPVAGRGGWTGVLAIRDVQGLGRVGGHMYIELTRRDARSNTIVRDVVFEGLQDAAGSLSGFKHPFGTPAPGFSTAAESHADDSAELQGVTERTEACLTRVVDAWRPTPYPVDGAVFGGYNSNSFALHMMKSCGLTAELPTTWYRVVPGDSP